MAEKRTKVSYENRKFNDSWTPNYFFILCGNKPVCLICLESIAVFKEYNIRRHYMSKHSDKYDKLIGEQRKEELIKLIYNLTGQQTILNNAYTERKSTRIKNENTQADTDLTTRCKKRKLQNQQEPAQLSSKVHECEKFDQLAVTWANILKNIDLDQQKYAIKSINDILCVAQSSALHRNSIFINGCVVTQALSTYINPSTVPDTVTDSEEVWPSDDVESLISLVQIHSVIYDPSDSDHKNREILEKSWQQISNKLKKTPELCSKKWQVLYSEYKQRKKNQNICNTKNNDWPHFNSLDFLKDLPDISYDKSSDHNLMPFPDGASVCQSDDTSEKNISPEEEFTNMNSLSSDNNIDIKIEIEDGLGDNFMEMADHSGNETLYDMERESNNEIDNNCRLDELERCSKGENGYDYYKTGTFKNGKSNSMEHFLLSLVEDASSLSKPAQRKFKSKILTVLEELQS